MKLIEKIDQVIEGLTHNVLDLGDARRDIPVYGMRAIDIMKIQVLKTIKNFLEVEMEGDEEKVLTSVQSESFDEMVEEATNNAIKDAEKYISKNLQD